MFAVTPMWSDLKVLEDIQTWLPFGGFVGSAMPSRYRHFAAGVAAGFLFMICNVKGN